MTDLVHRIEAIHRPVGQIGNVGGECIEDRREWPCPTIQAVRPTMETARINAEIRRGLENAAKHVYG
jgi:hypothetical protein